MSWRQTETRSQGLRIPGAIPPTGEVEVVSRAPPNFFPPPRGVFFFFFLRLLLTLQQSFFCSYCWITRKAGSRYQRRETGGQKAQTHNKGRLEKIHRGMAGSLEMHLNLRSPMRYTCRMRGNNTTVWFQLMEETTPNNTILPMPFRRPPRSSGESGLK